MLSGLENPLHLALLLLILVLVFGAKRLPELGRSLGSGIRGFRETVSGADEKPGTEGATQLSERTDQASSQTQSSASSKQ